MPIRVYYEDTDAGGIVFYANYLKYMERGRSDFLRLLGVDQRALIAGSEDGPLFFVVRRVELDYLRPAKFDDMVEVRTKFLSVAGASAVMAQEVWRGDELLVRGSVTIAAIGDSGAPRRFPRPLRHIFNMLL
nr:tol-pal system-associated acyl-CoA thioesterase [Govania unica]